MGEADASDDLRDFGGLDGPDAKAVEMEMFAETLKGGSCLFEA